MALIDPARGVLPPTESAPQPSGARRFTRVAADAGLSLGVGFAADAIFRSVARSAKGPAALVVGLVGAATLKATGSALLEVSLGDGQPGRVKSQLLDGFRTGLIDGALAIGARRLHANVTAVLPKTSGIVLKTAVSGSTIGSLGGLAYSATDHTTWKQGALPGLVRVGKSVAFGAGGGLVLGGVSGTVLKRFPGLFQAKGGQPPVAGPRTLTVQPAKSPVPVVEPVLTVKPVETPVVPVVPEAQVTVIKTNNASVTAVSGKVVAHGTAKVKTTGSIKGTVSVGGAKTVTKTSASGVVVESAASKVIKPALRELPPGASPALKGGPYHPDIVANRQENWAKLYGQAVQVPTRMTKMQATAAAEALGFHPTKYLSHGQPVFRNGNRYITPDVDSHIGGVWKMAETALHLASKTTRMGTYDALLIRLAD